MEQQTARRHYRHMTFNDRLKMEALLRAKLRPAEIARILGKHESTIYRELKRGQYEHLNTDYTTEMRYSPDKAQARAEANFTAMGAPLKIGSDYAFAEYIEHMIIKRKYSPEAALGEIKREGLEFKTKICVRTLYNYIDKGIFLNLTNKNLPQRGKRKRKYRRVRAARPPRGESIEKRPPEVEERKVFGHWEGDTVIGKRRKGKKLLFVLTERKTLHEKIFILGDKSAGSVVAALDKLEAKYGDAFREIFRTITFDNGTEFSDYEGMERSIFGGKRTRVFYCHPYSYFERGSNENQNRFIRRFYPKGTSFSDVSEADIENLEEWMNDYPRGKFGFKSAGEMFNEEQKKIFSKK